MQAKELREKLQTLDHALLSIVQDDARQEQAVKDACSLLLTKNARADLAQISVEEFKRSASGIRVQALQEAGYTDLEKIDRAQDYELRSIPGIGDKQIQTIRSIIRDFTNEIAKMILGGGLLHFSPTPKIIITTIIVALLGSIISNRYPVKSALRITPIKALSKE